MEVFVSHTQSCCFRVEGSNFPGTSLTSMKVAKAGSNSWERCWQGSPEMIQEPEGMGKELTPPFLPMPCLPLLPVAVAPCPS